MPNLEAVGAAVPEMPSVENRCLRVKNSHYALVSLGGKRRDSVTRYLVRFPSKLINHADE